MRGAFGDRLAEAVLGRAAACDRGGLADWWAFRGEAGGLWARLVVNSEQEVNPASRVLLTEARDGFGMRRAALDWRLTEMDMRTIKASALALARHVAAEDIGRIRLYDWILAQNPVAPGRGDGEGHVGSWHHMCTTRMADDPRLGVVDRDARIHGVANLYVGGSSAFSSVGYANPTYTIVQLALRLGDHLGRTLPDLTLLRPAAVKAPRRRRAPGARPPAARCAGPLAAPSPRPRPGRSGAAVRRDRRRTPGFIWA